MADEQRCPNCGAAQPANAPEGLCPRCLMRSALGEQAPADVAATMEGPLQTGAQVSPHARGKGAEATEAEDAAPAPDDATGILTGQAGGATLPTDGNGQAADLSRGAKVRYFGDYEIRRELGRGGMGVVYEARQVSLNRMVALKMVKAGLLAGDDELRRFQNEVEAVALLDHPGLVPVYEVGEHAGQRYFSMKLVAGGSLVSLLDRYTADPKAAAALVAEAAEAVAHAHMRGILHRDLKPANILVDDEGHSHVTDFGLAKRIEADIEFTATGAILGTPAYMSPEQATGRRGSITTATDVYGLGAVLYALLTGKAPFGGDSVVETIDAVRKNPPEPPTRLNTKVPLDLETICLKCLEKDPRRRYPTAQALADDLRSWLASRPIAARRVSDAERAWLWCRRQPAVAALIAFLAASLVVAACLSVAYAREQARRALYEQGLRLEITRERDKNAREAYDSDMALAMREWQDANPARVRELLEGTRPGSPAAPDLRSFEWFYLDRLGRTPLWSVTASDSVGSSLAAGPDGAWVAVALERQDGKPDDILILDARDGKVLRKIAAPHARFRRIAVSPDGRLLASAGDDGTIALHDPATGKPLPGLRGGVPRGSGAGGVSFSPDGRFLARLALTAELDRSRSLVELWDVPARKPLASLAIPSGVSALAFSPDGSRLATASTGLWIWNVSTGKLEREIEKGEPFTDVAYSPVGRLLAGATSSGWIGLWDPATGARDKTIGGHRGEIHRIRFSPDGRWLVSAGGDRVIKFWDVPSGALHHELRGHESRVWDLVFTPDGRRLASLGQNEGTVKFWDAHRTQESTDLTTDEPTADLVPVSGLAFSPDGRILAGAQAPGALRAWDAALGTPLFGIDGKAKGGRGWVAIAPRSNLLATLDDQRAIVLRDPSTGAVVRSLEASGESRTGAFSPDGCFLVAGSDRMSTIRVWDVATGRLDATLEGHTQPVECLAFSSDGLKLASGGFDATVTIWDFPSRKPVLTYRGHSRGISGIVSLAFHPDGRSLASSRLVASGYGEIRLWDAGTGRDTRIVRGHTGFVRRLSFLPDGQRLASLGDDGVLKLWDTESGREALSIAAHSRNGLGLAVSPDGQRLATSGVEGAVRIWDSRAPLPRNPRSQVGAGN